MKSHDLFPQTLLVSREGEHIYTTSRRVAFHFGKRHKDVLRIIQKLLADLNSVVGDGRNFAPISPANLTDFELSEYTDERNRQKPEYLLSHDGFALLAMGFTGKGALRWKVAFLQEFRRMEAELAALRARYVAALDMVRPHLRVTVEEAESGVPRLLTAQRLGKSVAAVTYHRRQARRFGLLAAPRRRGLA